MNKDIKKQQMYKYHQGAPIDIQRASQRQDANTDDENARKFFGKPLKELTGIDRLFLEEIREQNRE